jgi:hypothetical protein
LTFISFTCLIFLARTFSTMLTKNGDIGNLSLVIDITGKAFSFQIDLSPRFHLQAL